MKNLKDFIGQISHNNTKNHIIGESKAIFVTGGPGSGKDVIIREILSHVDITEINHMQAYNYLSDKKKLYEESSDYRRETIRNHQPVIINAPADDIDRILYIREELEELNYDTMLIFVSTSNNISKIRNENLPRMMHESVRHIKWSNSQNNKLIYKECFNNFIQINNNLSMKHIEEDIDVIYRKINKFFISESSKPVMLKYNNPADGPDDIIPDNRGGNAGSLGDEIKGDTPARKNPGKSYIFKTYSEENSPTVVVNNGTKVSNFSKDKETTKKKGLKDSPTVNQRLRNVDGVGPQFDTRQQGTVYPMSGLGDVTYRESRDFKSFRNKLKEAIDDPGAVDMGVGGVLNGSTNKEPMQSYNDQDKKIGIKIIKKGKNKNV